MLEFCYLLARVFGWTREDCVLVFGTPIYEIPGSSNTGMDRWISLIAERSGQTVVWYSCGGTDRIYALGDLDRVREAIKFFMDQNPRRRGYPEDQLRWVDQGSFLVVC